MSRHRLLRTLWGLSTLLVLAATSPLIAQDQPPAPASSVEAADTSWDKGESITVTWNASADDVADGAVDAYMVQRSRTATEHEKYVDEEIKKIIGVAVKEATDAFRLEQDPEVDLRGSFDIKSLTDAERADLRARRLAAAAAAKLRAETQRARIEAEAEFVSPGIRVVASQGASYELDFTELKRTVEVDDEDVATAYTFRVAASTPEGVLSSWARSGDGLPPVQQPFDGTRFYLLIITSIFCGSVMYWIFHARSGREIRVRKIGGLSAVDEAVGRATEMGRSILFVPGIQDMNEIQTIAGITILSRVARLAAEYDAKIEVPTARSLVMTACRETVQASFLEAGRPDAYNQDNVHYVTNEQFGYVAYLSGMMVREKPAACFYMGAFFAESLILAETGNAIGAIQVAGTAQPAQLPFFVAACDYTLIGEEFFAASAYLTQSPEELGSLKGQDVGKILVAVVLVVGVVMATVAEKAPALEPFVNFLKSTILT